MLIRIEGFSQLPDQVRESAMDQIQHADTRIAAWRAEGDGVSLQLSEGAADPALEERVRKLMKDAIDSYRFFKTEMVEDNEGAPTNDISPFPRLLETGQVSMIAPGTPVYQGDMARYLAQADDRFREIAWRRGGIEQSYPSTVSTVSLATNGYLSSYPQHAIFAAALHRDVDSLNEAGKLASANGERYPTAIRPFMAEAGEVLSPTVCYRCFDSLRASPGLARPLMSGRTFTGLANCHRREDKALVELSRLQTFRMREVVFFGAANFVGEQRDWWMDEFAGLLRAWRMRFRIVAASDAFFSATAAQKRAYQSMRRLKYECQAYLPHSDTWLAVASFNNHEATLTKAYGLLAGDDAQAHSGCVGFGLDRLVFAVLSQFGLDEEAWPDHLRAFFANEANGDGWRLTGR
jgi:hypothetical protein